MKPSVLVVEPRRAEGEPLARLLADRGYLVRVAPTADAALTAMKASRPALAIVTLDAELDALSLCQAVRESLSTPIIVLSDEGSSATEVMAFDAGADDFLVRPVRPESLLARVRALVRRAGGGGEQSSIGVGPFHIDFDDRRVHVRGQAVRLTPKEFDLFTFMATHPNRVLPHKMLLGAVWGPASEEQAEYLRVFVGQLRKKLEADPSRPRHLVTEPWVGYRFNPDGAERV
jgi:two-component system KDP operon response regulator KdpE